MNAIRFTSKEAFAAALEDRRAYWQAFDKRQASRHKADEKAYLDKSRATLREALKMDYATLKSVHGYSVTLGSTPTCPALWEPKIDRALRALNLTQGKTFVVSSEGQWSDAHALLTHDPDAPKTVC